MYRHIFHHNVMVTIFRHTSRTVAGDGLLMGLQQGSELLQLTAADDPVQVPAARGQTRIIYCKIINDPVQDNPQI